MDAEERLGRFYHTLFTTGTAQAGDGCHRPITKAGPSSLFNSSLTNRIKWRAGELPGAFKVQLSHEDLICCREFARRYYQCFVLFHHFDEQSFQLLNSAADIDCGNEQQIVGVDAICYDGTALLDRIQMAAHVAGNDENEPRAQSLQLVAGYLMRLLPASPLTSLRELRWPAAGDKAHWRLIADNIALRREAIHCLALCREDHRLQANADKILAHLDAIGYGELATQALSLRAHYKERRQSW